MLETIFTVPADAEATDPGAGLAEARHEGGHRRLIAAAHALVGADGAVRLQEVPWLASLQDSLLSL